MIVQAYGITYTSVCICNMQIQLKNINISQVNDLFTPKPAKLDKHIYIYTCTHFNKNVEIQGLGF